MNKAPPAFSILIVGTAAASLISCGLLRRITCAVVTQFSDRLTQFSPGFPRQLPLRKPRPPILDSRSRCHHFVMTAELDRESFRSGVAYLQSSPVA